MASSVRLSDGFFDYSEGVDSGKVTMVKSAVNPNGLDRNQLAWMDNCTCRGGSLQPKDGYQSLAKVAKSGLYQGGFLYSPDFDFPYLMLSISGQIYKVILGADNTSSSVTNLTPMFPFTQNPPAVPQVWMAQGEKFLVIQPGDLTAPKPTSPLFWDGVTLRRSKGLTSQAVAPGTPGVNEIPAAGPMVYYQGRLWYAQGRQYNAGDIVYGNSGTAANLFRDAILNVTENPLCVGGDGFAVPSTAGNITALFYTATLDSTLGQGSLYIGTARQVFQLTVPINRSDWIAAGANNQPKQVVVQLAWGPVSDRTITHVNGDVFYQSFEPAIRSLTVATRYFGQWANTPLSRNINRVLAFNDRSLMQFSCGIEFDNRLLQAIQPVQTPVGTAFKAIAALDFDIISRYSGAGQASLPPAWEGIREGIDVLQLFSGVFGGQPRAFAAVHSKIDGSIEVWEMTDYLLVDNNAVNGITDSRIDWYFETPAYTWGREFDLKELDGGELWIDQVSGTVDMIVNFRADGDPCWQFWTYQQFCAARNNAENPNIPPQQYGTSACPGWEFPITLPKPQLQPCQTNGSRPSLIGYQFQVQVIIKGSCRVRGMILHALPKERRAFEGLRCGTTSNPTA